MAWETEERGLTAPSAGYRRLLAASLLLVFTGAAWCQAPPADVRDCQPCSFQPSPSRRPYFFTFEVKTTRDGRAVQAISVGDGNGVEPLQRLVVKDMMPIAEGESFFFGGVDLDQDGFLDLMLITNRGIANAYADYWLFEPTSGRYKYLGKFPVFRVNAESRRLLTYERGGEAGLIFESREYEFSDGRILLVKSEKQDATAHPGIFKKVTRERINGAMQIVRVEKVKAP